MNTIIVLFIGIIIGIVIGFLVSLWFLKKKLKNSFQIDENFISDFLSGMGRTPTKKQTKSIVEKIKKKLNEL